MAILALTGLDSVAQFAAGSLAFRAHTLVAIATIVFSVLALPLQLEMQFSGRPVEFVVISFIGALLTSISSVFAIVWLELGALGLLLGGLLGQALVWGLLLVRSRGAPKSYANSEIAKELLKHGLPLLPSFVLLFVLQNGVRWHLESVHGVGEVGLYSIGSNFGSILTLVTSGFVTAWMPWAMQLSDSWEEGRHVVAQRLTQYVIGIGFLVLLFFCMAQPILWITTSHDYFGAWVVVGMSAVTSFMMSLFSLLLPPVYMAAKVSLVLISQSVAALVSIGSAYILIDLGSIGASASVMLGSIALVVVQLFVNATLTGRTPIPFDVKRLSFVVFLISVACYLTFWFQLDRVGSFILQSAALILSTGYVLFRCLPDRATLLKMVSRKK
jgi:O-antigen/teichoic acid export membrane protein